MPAEDIMPDAGDVVWANFHPSAGHEQTGVRPALVLSPKSYNERSSVVIVCPITKTASRWPFFVAIDENPHVVGFVMVDQIKSIDRAARIIRATGRVPERTLMAVREALADLVDITL
jgi:mRNA interferase MazF